MKSATEYQIYADKKRSEAVDWHTKARQASRVGNHAQASQCRANASACETEAEAAEQALDQIGTCHAG